MFGKRIYRGIFAFLFLLSLFINNIKGQTETLRINEFMALNQTSLADEDSEYSDWIELYNPTLVTINLQNWTLTDDINEPQKWVFPDINLASNNYLVLFASGKDKTVAGNELHTNFRLNGDGEYFALFNPEGTAVSEFNPMFPKQQVDVSYGYFENTYISFLQPTPGAENLQSGGIILPPPVLNIKHGIYETPFNLEISSDISGTEIYYTTDGSVPSSGNGTLYSSPINIQTTTIIRAVNTLDDQSLSKVATQTYLFLDDVIHQPNDPEAYPSEWGPYVTLPGNAIADYEMDSEMMTDPAFANRVKEALLDIPTLSLVSNKDNFFSHDIDSETGGIYIYTGAPGDETGLGWERPVSIEYFNSEDSIDFQVDCGVRLQGGHSRRPEKCPKHSFLLLFKSEYGPSRLNYPILGEKSAQSFNNLILRAGFGLSWLHWSSGERERGQLQRDIWTKDAQRAMGHPSSNSSYVHLYINGIYWGVYAPSERMDADYAVSYFGGDELEYDVIKDYMESGMHNPAVDGNTEAWDEMIGMVNGGLVNNEAYQAIQGNNPDGTRSVEHEAMIDIINFADYMLLNFYGSNTDWDHHNWAAIRNQVNPGKGFKFFSWDAEHMIKSVNGNMLSENNDYCPSRIFQKASENEDFRRLFADRVVKHCYNGGALSPEGAAQLWSIRKAQVEKSMDAESARWGDYRRDVHPWSSGPYELYKKDTYWLTEQNFMLNTYFPERTDLFVNQLKSAGLYPNINAPTLLINGNPITQKTISVGDILTMSAPEGTIYYTTNGIDPAVLSSSQDYIETTLISENSDKKVMVPKSDIGTTWLSDINYNDSGWELCSGSPGGVGYDNNTDYQSLISLDVRNDMYTAGVNPNPSCYIRITFNINANDLSTFTSLLLSIRYDDGFVAYLNGTKVAETNAPDAPQWNSASTDGHEAEYAETFNISEFINELTTGDNLLAIQGLNTNLTSSDFIISAELKASDQPASGGISSEAIIYSGPVTINKSSHIKARAFHNGEWSAASDKFLVIPADYDDIKITEIHYHPLAMDTIEDGNLEFIELKNTGTSTLDISGLEFVNGIDYEFPQETQLGPNKFMVLASYGKYFYKIYGFMPFDNYRGQLDNNGERIVLLSPINDTLCSIRYYDTDEWPDSTDGEGYSMVPTELNPTNDQNNPSDWRRSYNMYGSPGADDLDIEPIYPYDPNKPVDPGEPDQMFEITAYKNTSLSQNYPNPFSNITYIDYQLPSEAHVILTIYNMIGQNVITLINRQVPAGLYQVEWNGKDQNNNEIPGGIYFYRMEVKGQDQTEVITKKMILTK